MSVSYVKELATRHLQIHSPQSYGSYSSTYRVCGIQSLLYVIMVDLNLLRASSIANLVTKSLLIYTICISLSDNLCKLEPTLSRNWKKPLPAPLFYSGSHSPQNPNSFFRVLPCCWLTTEHEGISSLSYHVCNISHLCPSWCRILNHGLK